MNILSVTLEEALVMACCRWRAFSTSLGGRREKWREEGREGGEIKPYWSSTG
jgi:hypothetical protein